ncbi:LysR substrate-binding domain-containing protein [Klebsiella michiganensis]|nr:LysR substrate-binding domain-containing protein [Klebsiella michiganensis]
MILHFLMPLIRPFRERYPEMSLTLVSSETFINLIERKVDVAIRAGTLTDSSLRARPLFNSYRKIIASPDYLARHGTPQSVAELKNHQCLGFSEPASLNTWSVSCCDGTSCWKSKARYLPIAEKRSSSCACTGNGIACLSDYMVDKEIAEGAFVELLADKRLPVEMPFSAVYYSDRAVSTRIRAFIDFLSEHVKQLPKEL